MYFRPRGLGLFVEVRFAHKFCGNRVGLYISVYNSRSVYTVVKYDHTNIRKTVFYELTNLEISRVCIIFYYNFSLFYVDISSAILSILILFGQIIIYSLDKFHELI